MSILSQASFFLTEFLGIYNFLDFIEISLMSFFCYLLLNWLNIDKQNNLLYYFYAYCGIYCAALLFQMEAINYLLINFLPVISVLFIIIHQERLQKNFISFKKIDYTEKNTHWFDEFTRTCLNLLNSKKEILFVIERQDNIKQLINTSCTFFADFKKDIFDIIIEKHNNSYDNIIWINQEGKIVAINCSWNLNIEEFWIDEQTQALYKWKQDAIYISSKTDAIILKINTLTRTFDIIMANKILENLSAQQLFSILERNLLNLNKKEINSPILNIPVNKFKNNNNYQN